MGATTRGPVLTRRWARHRTRTNARAKPAPTVEEGCPTALFFPSSAASSGWASTIRVVEVPSAIMGGANKRCPFLSFFFSSSLGCSMVGRIPSEAAPVPTGATAYDSDLATQWACRWARTKERAEPAPASVEDVQQPSSLPSSTASSGRASPSISAVEHLVLPRPRHGRAPPLIDGVWQRTDKVERCKATG